MSKGYRKTILLVEKQGNSSVGSNVSCKKDLEKLDFDVVMADTGEGAIQIAGSGADIDLILMDIELGDGMDGAQAAEQILEKRDLPILFILSSPDAETLKKVEGITSYGFVTRNSSAAEWDLSVKMALRLFESINITKKELVDRKQVEKESRRVQQQLQMVMENFPDGIIVLYDRQFRYHLAEGCGLANIGLSKDHLLGKTIRDLFSAGFSDLLEKKIVNAFEGVKETFEIAMGHQVFTETVLPVKNERGQVEFVLGVITDITERKQTEEALQSALIEAENGKRTLNALMEHIPVGITIADADLRLLQVSRRGLEIMGWPVNRHIGLSVEEILSEWEVYMADGITKARVEELPLSRAIMNGETVFGQEIVQRHADGRIIPLTCDAGPIKDSEDQITGGIIAWQDITERKQAEEALKGSEEHLSAILRSIGDGVIACDSEGKVTYLNIAAEALTGWKSQEAAGLAVEKVFRIINAKTRETV